VVHHLEIARDTRWLALHEKTLRQHLKLKALGLSLLQHTIAWQGSRLLWLRDKASGPDGFMSRFLQTAWEVIREDIMRAYDAFWHLDTCNLHSINEALMTLIPKTTEVASLKDYRPISLIHSLGKLLSKILVNKLTTRLGELVHPT
jgi:hypothetical protein